tara:strand:+ start:2035 stop:3258 length:1224 start_codon:yes stop_codon:yes gene_type:complete
MSNILKYLTELRPDIHFTVLTPKIMPGFQYENTEQIIYKQPTYPNEMRQHFDTYQLSKITDFKTKDWDFLYTYLPEHTLQLENHFRNLTNCRPVIFGYDAYIEIPKTTGYEASLLRQHYAGLMSMNSCGVNSQAVKDTIIEHAPTCLPDSDVEILKDKIEPLPRGWDNVEGPRKKPQTEPKIIVWNHRANSYKSYPWFLQQIDKLWEQRKDFTAWVPLSDSIDREYIYNKKFDRQGYFTELSKCWVGVCGQSHHTGWANSASDGMAVGVPYIFYNADYYSQYAEKAGLYFDKDEEFLKKMNMMLDNENLREEYSNRCIELGKENSWENIIKKYNSHFVRAEKKFKKVKKDTDGYNKILNYIHKVGSVTKEQIMDYLGWGRGIPFDIYRNRLREEPTIKLTKSGYEVR